MFMKNGMDNKPAKIRKTCFAGFVVTAAVAVALPIILISSASRSGMFWFKIVWAVILTSIVWASLYLFFATPLHPDEPRKGVGRISSALAIGGFWYALISLVLMVAISFLPQADWLDRVHMAAQIILGAAAVLLGLFLRINLTIGGSKAPDLKQPTTKAT